MSGDQQYPIACHQSSRFNISELINCSETIWPDLEFLDISSNNEIGERKLKLAFGCSVGGGNGCIGCISNSGDSGDSGCGSGGDVDDVDGGCSCSGCIGGCGCGDYSSCGNGGGACGDGGGDSGCGGIGSNYIFYFTNFTCTK